MNVRVLGQSHNVRSIKKSGLVLISLTLIIAGLQNAKVIAITLAFWLAQYGPNCTAGFARNQLKARSPESLESLVSLLGTTDDVSGALVSLILADIGPEAVPELVKGLKSSDRMIRLRSIIVLGTNLAESAWPAIPDLLMALTDTDPHVRLWAAVAISNIDSSNTQVIPFLFDFLKNGCMELRVIALNALWKLGQNTDFGSNGKFVVPILVEFLDDNSWKNRRDALFILARIGSDARSALPKVTKCLSDQDPEVRANARVAIKLIGAEAVRKS